MRIAGARRSGVGTTGDLATSLLRSLRVGPWPRYLRAAVLLCGIAFVGARGIGLIWPEAYDAFSYWSVDLSALYGVGATARPGAYGFFPYSPAIGQLMSPLGLLPWAPFLGLWTAFIGICAVLLTGWLAAPLAWFWAALGIELLVGNIDLPIALAIVVGFRYPAAWSFVLLTKVTCGIGLLWFAVRGEWRALGIALGVTAAAVGISFIVAPGLWSDWLTVLLDSGTSATAPAAWLKVPLLVRLPIAALVIAVAGRTDRRWLVPLGCLIALPVVWESALTILLATVPLLDRRVRDRLAVWSWLPGASTLRASSGPSASS